MDLLKRCKKPSFDLVAHWPIILALQRLRQENGEFKDSLSYNIEILSLNSIHKNNKLI